MFLWAICLHSVTKILQAEVIELERNKCKLGKLILSLKELKQDKLLQYLFVMKGLPWNNTGNFKVEKYVFTSLGLWYNKYFKCFVHIYSSRAYLETFAHSSNFIHRNGPFEVTI